jgi:methylated-DNA-protein-cysteine methyltransferase-like protein
MSKGFFSCVYNLVMQIPAGHVVTYSQIAKALGKPRSARVVGWALHVNPDNRLIPCHRVVNSQGMISSGFAFGGPDEQRKMLESEGIIFDKDNRINLDIYRYIY